MSATPIRVLHLGSPTGLSGAECWILALVKHLPPQHIESIVGTIKDSPGSDPALCQQAAATGTRTAIFEAHGKLSRSAVQLLRTFIRTNGVDILHTHGYKSDILGCLGAQGTGCKVVATPHGWSAHAGVTVGADEALNR